MCSHDPQTPLIKLVLEYFDLDLDWMFITFTVQNDILCIRCKLLLKAELFHISYDFTWDWNWALLIGGTHYQSNVELSAFQK